MQIGIFSQIYLKKPMGTDGDGGWGKAWGYGDWGYSYIKFELLVVKRHRNDTQFTNSLPPKCLREVSFLDKTVKGG